MEEITPAGSRDTNNLGAVKVARSGDASETRKTIEVSPIVEASESCELAGGVLSLTTCVMISALSRPCGSLRPSSFVCTLL